MGPYTLCTSNHAVPCPLPGASGGRASTSWGREHLQEAHLGVCGWCTHLRGSSFLAVCNPPTPGGEPCFRSSQLSDLLFPVNRWGPAGQAGSPSGNWRGEALLLWFDIRLSLRLISVHTVARLLEGRALSCADLQE